MANEGLLPLPSPQHLHTIFVDTSIDTHLALILSIHDTISDVKDKIRAEHALCFKDIGEIAIQAMKVRRRGVFYNLADSMYVLNAFDGVKGSWFLCIDVVPICSVKAQEVVTNNLTHEHVPVCGVNMHKEIVSCGLLPKDQDAVMIMSSAGNLNAVKHGNLKSFDASLKDLLPVEDGPSLQNGRISPAQSLQACSTDKLIPADRNMKTSNGMMVDVVHLLEDVAVSRCEPEKTLCPDRQGIHSPIVTTVDYPHRSEMLIDEEDGGRKNDSNYPGLESGDVMPSTCIPKTKSRKRHKILKDGLHGGHHVDPSRGGKLSKTEDNDKSNKSINLQREINCDEKTETVATSERLPSNLLHENLSPQKPPDEKHKKKRRKKSKLNVDDHLDAPYEIPVAPSPKVTVDSHNSGKEDNASISLGKSPPELNVDERLQSNDRDISLAPDNVSSLVVVSEKEIRYSMETCLSKETAEVQTLPVGPDRRKKPVNLGQESNPDVSLKELEKARISSHVASEFSTKLSCSGGNFRSQSSKVLAYNERNDHQNIEFDATKGITEVNLREEIGSADANVGLPTSTEKLPYQQQVSNFHSKDTPSDKLRGLDKEINSAANLKTEERNKRLANVDSRVPGTSRRSRKNSRSESSRGLDSTELNVKGGHFNSDGAQVFFNDVQNDATISIKQADQKDNGGRSVVDSTVEIFSSTKKLPDQGQVPDMDRGNLPVGMPLNLSRKSTSVKAAAEINASSQPVYEEHEKPRRRRKKSKNELSIPGSPEIRVAVLTKFSADVTETNEGRQSVPSKLDNASSQKIEQHFMDAKDLSGQSNAKITIEEYDIAQHGGLMSPRSMRDGKKSKKEELEDRVSSEMSDRAELRRPGNSTLTFADYFVHKQCPSTHPSDLPSEKSKTRKKQTIRRKTYMNQPCQDSPTNSVQTFSDKQHPAVCPTLDNDIREHKHHKVTSHTQDNNTSHSNTIDASQYAATRDCKPVNPRKTRNTERTSKQKSRIKSDSSLHKAHEDQKLVKELQDYGPQSYDRPSESGDMRNKQEKMDLLLDHGIDNMVSKDGGAQHKDHYSPSEGVAQDESSGDDTDDTPNHHVRYRVVRKTQRRGSKKMVNNPELLLNSSGRMFSDASGASSDSGSDSYERKAAISAGLSLPGDSDSRLEETQTKANALKHQIATSSSESDRSEASKDVNHKVEDACRSAASSHKIPLSAILKSSSSYKKARLTASQSEFAIAESQPVDIVLETQPDPEP